VRALRRLEGAPRAALAIRGGERRYPELESVAFAHRRPPESLAAAPSRARRVSSRLLIPPPLVISSLELARGRQLQQGHGGVHQEEVPRDGAGRDGVEGFVDDGERGHGDRRESSKRRAVGRASEWGGTRGAPLSARPGLARRACRPPTVGRAPAVAWSATGRLAMALAAMPPAAARWLAAAAARRWRSALPQVGMRCVDGGRAGERARKSPTARALPRQRTATPSFPLHLS